VLSDVTLNRVRTMPDVAPEIKELWITEAVSLEHPVPSLGDSRAAKFGRHGCHDTHTPETGAITLLHFQSDVSWLC